MSKTAGMFGSFRPLFVSFVTLFDFSLLMRTFEKSPSSDPPEPNQIRSNINRRFNSEKKLPRLDSWLSRAQARALCRQDMKGPDLKKVLVRTFVCRGNSRPTS